MGNILEVGREAGSSLTCSQSRQQYISVLDEQFAHSDSQ